VQPANHTRATEVATGSGKNVREISMALKRVKRDFHHITRSKGKKMDAENRVKGSPDKCAFNKLYKEKCRRATNIIDRELQQEIASVLEIQKR